MSPPNAARTNHRGDTRALSTGRRLFDTLRAHSEGRRRARDDDGNVTTSDAQNDGDSDMVAEPVAGSPGRRWTPGFRRSDPRASEPRQPGEVVTSA